MEKNAQNNPTYICILGVDASSRYDPGLLFVLIQDEWIGVDVATNDSEPSFVGDPLAVSESRGSIWVARHDIESSEGNCCKVAMASGRCRLVR
jgi:hypothetical protein